MFFVCVITLLIFVCDSEGSVVFDGVTSFTSLGTDTTSSLDFANDIRQTVLASLSNSNPTGIISTTLKVSGKLLDIKKTILKKLF